MADSSCVVRYQELNAMNASAGTSRVPHLAMDGSRSVPVQERGSIGFQYHSSKIGRAPWPPTLDEPSCLASRARTILSRTTQRRSYHPVPLPVRTHSGEERGYQGRSPCLVRACSTASG